MPVFFIYTRIQYIIAINKYNNEYNKVKKFLIYMHIWYKSTTSTHCSTKNALFELCSEMPGSCGKAEVIDWAPTFADLFWTPPTHDGGTPILTYIIQMKGIAPYCPTSYRWKVYSPYWHTSYRWKVWPILAYIIQMKGIAHTHIHHTDERYDPYWPTSYRWKV